jgi:TolB-like protein/DNA-binding winged helix-turn-helix (wHTH) protein
MKTTIARTALFGPYALDLRSGELRKHGAKVRMGEQPFQILLMLLERPGEMVAREELRAKLWADDTFVDFDHGLNSAVQRLRDCLSDTAEEPLWVETVPRRGYRFIGQVELAGGTGLSPLNGDGAAPRDETAPDGEGEVTTGARRPAQERGRGKEFRSAAIWIAVVAALLLAWPLIRVGARWKTTPKEESVPIRSIAVLPLENLSGDPAQDYFADGMTDELITTLAKNQALRITSRTSVMRYRSPRRPIGEIANELGVDGVIVGSVARSGNRVRVNAQLIRASNDSHIWSESYERDLGDVLSLQDELARAIADEVRVTATPPEASSATAATRFNPEAHDAYLRGRYYWFHGEFPKSREFFQKAIDLDPAYAPGYAGLADSYMGQSGTAGMPVKEGLARGEAAARKALEIDDSLAEAHLSLAAAKFFFHWDWPGAETEIRRAIELNPSLSEAHHLYDYILSGTNRFPEGLQEERIAQQLDPLDRPWAVGRQFYRQRRFDEAIRELRSQIEIEPNIDALHGVLSDAYYFKGMLKESIIEREKLLVINGDPNDAAAEDRTYKTLGMRAVQEWRLEQLKRRGKNQYVSPWDLARLSAAAGRNDEAIGYLQEALDQRLSDLVLLKQEPYFDSLQSDTRYQAIVKRVGLP